MQLQRNARRRSNASSRRLRDRDGRRFRCHRGRIFTRAVHGAMLRRRSPRFPRQQIAVTHVLQWNHALFQHSFNALVLLWVTHIGHGNVKTDVLRTEVFAHAPSARLCVWTVYAPKKAHTPVSHTVYLISVANS